MTSSCITAGALLLLGWTSCAQVVINEVHYHPSNDDDALQFVELFNAGAAEADLSGWKLRGAKFDFPNNARIGAGQHAVIARDAAKFRQAYGGGAPVLGTFSGRLKRSGEKLDLVNASGAVVESFRFLDEPPWPLGPDGYGSSLERISPLGAADDPSNWASSAPGENGEGTPGHRNSTATAAVLPAITEAAIPEISAPDQPIPVAVSVRSEKPIAKAVLEFEVTRPRQAKSTGTAALDLTKGGRLEGRIPPQPEGTLIRSVLRVADQAGLERTFPAPHEPRPAFSTYISAPANPSKIPVVSMLSLPAGYSRRGGWERKFQPPQEDLPERGSAAFVYAPPGGKTRLFDFVDARSRSGGWKIHFLKDQLLEGMSAINIISEGPPRWILAEHLAYELYRRAGVIAPTSGFFRVSAEGRPAGVFLWVEQPNKTFLDRSGRSKDGNLYKIQWQERDIVRKHEKKTNRAAGHDDIVSLVQALHKKSGEDQWNYIQQQFDAANAASYFAVNMCIQNWDGFFNNYYAYHDLKPGGKWEIIPWDEDKTWGEFDGANPRYDWYSMPLTMGMNGDRPPTSWTGRGPYGGPGWWRPAGVFSGPLLANPHFRKQFEARLKELCGTVFTEERFFPVIQSVQLKLADEYEAADLERNLDTFRRQLTNRRKFILQELKD